MPLLEQVLENNKNNVKMVFKNFPLNNIHKFADPAARAALAAHKQGKFWEFHDTIFTAGKLSDSLIYETAAKIGLEPNQFKADMDSAAVISQVAKDLQDGTNAGVRGTPTIFINGTKLKDRSPQGFQAVINDALKKKAGKK